MKKIFRSTEFEGERHANRQFVMALARGLEVLRTFTPHEGALSNTELALRTGLPKPTISRLTYTLMKLGYLEFDEQIERYRLGPAVLALGYAFSSNLEVRNIARPRMQEFADKFGVTVGLAVPDRLSFIMVEICSHPNAMRLVLDVGSRIPLTKSASTAGYLNSLTGEERKAIEEIVSEEAPEEWAAFRPELDACIDEVEKLGFCVLSGKIQKNVHVCSTPILPPRRKTFLALLAYAPTFVYEKKDFYDEIGPQLASLSELIASEFSVRSPYL